MGVTPCNGWGSLVNSDLKPHSTLSGTRLTCICFVKRMFPGFQGAEVISQPFSMVCLMTMHCAAPLAGGEGRLFSHINLRSGTEIRIQEIISCASVAWYVSQSKLRQRYTGDLLHHSGSSFCHRPLVCGDMDSGTSQAPCATAGDWFSPIPSPVVTL